MYTKPASKQLLCNALLSVIRSLFSLKYQLSQTCRSCRGNGLSRIRTRNFKLNRTFNHSPSVNLFLSFFYLLVSKRGGRLSSNLPSLKHLTINDSKITLHATLENVTGDVSPKSFVAFYLFHFLWHDYFSPPKFPFSRFQTVSPFS